MAQDQVAGSWEPTDSLCVAPHGHPERSPHGRHPTGKGEQSGTGNTLKSGCNDWLRWDSARMTHLALLEDVPEQRQVLCSEVPERPDAPAMADGDQVQVIQLQRPGVKQAQQVTARGGHQSWNSPGTP